MRRKRKKTPRKTLLAANDRLWSALILARDERVCQMCYRPGNNPHHVFSRRHLTVRWALDNGVTLCWACHMHKAHGDPELFRDFFIRRVGQKTFDQLKVMAYATRKVDLTIVNLYLKQVTEKGEGRADRKPDKYDRGRP